MARKPNWKRRGLPKNATEKERFNAAVKNRQERWLSEKIESLPNDPQLREFARNHPGLLQ